MIIELRTAGGNLVRGKPIDMTNSSLAMEDQELTAVYRVPREHDGKRVRWILIEEIAPPTKKRVRTVLEWAGLVATDETSPED